MCNSKCDKRLSFFTKRHEFATAVAANMQASQKKLFIFWVLLFNAILFSASRTIHHRHASRKAVKASKKQTMYLPGVMGGQYGQYPAAPQSQAQGCCSSYPSQYPSQYPVQAQPQPAQPQPAQPQPAQQQQSCCDSSNPSPPPCCINLKPGQSKEVKLNAAGKNYVLTVNLGGNASGNKTDGSNKSRDASVTKAPSQSIPINSGPTTQPSTNGGSSTGSTMGPTTSPSTRLPVNANNGPGSTTPTNSPGSTGGSSDNGSDNISEEIDKTLSKQGGQGSKNPKNGTNPNAKPKGQGMTQNKQGLGQGDGQHGNEGQGHNGPGHHGQGQKPQKQGQGQGQGQGKNPNSASANKDQSKEMEIFVGTPLVGSPLDQVQDKGKGHRNGKGNEIHKQEDACMEGPSMCGQAASPPCAPPTQGMNPCSPPQGASMPCSAQQGNPCQQSAPAMPCPPPLQQQPQQQTTPCAPQAPNPCAQAPAAPCPPQQSIDPCAQVGPCMECPGGCGPGGETDGGENGGTGTGEGGGAGGGGGGTGEGIGGGGGGGEAGGTGGETGGGTGKGTGGGGGGTGGGAGGGGGGEGTGVGGGGAAGTGAGGGGAGGGAGGGGGGAGTGAGGGGGGAGGGAGGVKPPNKACVQETLQLHNTLRAKHGSPPLKLNAAMTQGAQSYAKQLASAGGELNHSPQNQRPNQGENLASACAKPAKPADCKAMTQRWYDEVSKHNWNNPVFTKAAGHFTQLVWKATTELGVGLAQFVKSDGMTCHVLVARYKPPGNVPGGYKANVLRGSG